MKTLAHRGFINPTPYQNSMEAFKHAVATCDGFETDTIVSKDGTIYLLHAFSVYQNNVIYNANHHLDEISAKYLGDQQFVDLSDDEISELSLKDGSPIPELSDVLPLFSGKADKLLNLEIKDPKSVNALLKMLKDAINAGIITAEQLVLSSFHHKSLYIVRKELPDVKIGFLWTPNTGLNEAQFNALKNNLLEREATKCLEFQDDVNALKPDFMITSHHNATDEQIADFLTLAPNAKIMVWEYTEANSPERPILQFIEKNKHQPWLHAVIVDQPI